MKPKITEVDAQTIELSYIHYDEPLDEKFIELVRKDYDYMMNNIRLGTSDTMKSILLMQSGQGHAMQGHMSFSSKNPKTRSTIEFMGRTAGLENSQMAGKTVIVRYPNTAIDDIIHAVSENQAEVVSTIMKRQQYIDEVFSYVKRVAEYMKKKSFNGTIPIDRLNTARGEPLMRIDLFNQYTRINNPLKVIRGMYLGSRLDSSEWRLKTENTFKDVFPGLKLHKGECVAVDRRKMKEKGLTLYNLANAGIKKIPQEDLDYVIMKNNETKSSRRYVCGFHELEAGYGVSDDAAWNFIALLWGIEAGYGFTLVDAIDTMDKCVPHIIKGGSDEYLGDYILDLFDKKDLGIEDRDIHNMIYAASVDASSKRVYPSSSLRRFVELNSKNDNALVIHRAFINYIIDKDKGSLRPGDIRLAYDQVDSKKFQKEFKKRARTLVETGQMEYSQAHKELVMSVNQR